jgi:hypothetical protein
MEKLLGMLPYIYLFDGPIELGNVRFTGFPNLRGQDCAPANSNDREFLKELSERFHVSRGLASDKGVVRALTYFLLNIDRGNDEEILEEGRKAVTLLRYMMLDPESHALDDLETATVYCFELPPVGNDEYHIYRCWINFNREDWTTLHRKFYPPGWNVNLRIIPCSNLVDLEHVSKQFYSDYLDDRLEADILLSMEWYNLSFARYSLHGIAGQLLDISVAFETLFRLQEHKATLYDCINRTLGMPVGSPLEQWSRDFYGKVRSATSHFGKPATLIYRHPEAQEGHLSFLWSAQRIFRECVAIKAGLERKLTNDRLIEELTPNEVILKRLRNMGSYENIKKAGALWEVWKLRQIYPVGKRDDIVWVGKMLLGEMAKRLVPKDPETLSSVLVSILNTRDDDEMLGWKYYQLMEQLKGILDQDDGAEVRHLVLDFHSAYLVRHFAEFAGYALTTLYHSHKQERHRP